MRINNKIDNFENKGDVKSPLIFIIFMFNNSYS